MWVSLHIHRFHLTYLAYLGAESRNAPYTSKVKKETYVYKKRLIYRSLFRKSAIAWSRRVNASVLWVSFLGSFDGSLAWVSFIRLLHRSLV